MLILLLLGTLLCCVQACKEYNNCSATLLEEWGNGKHAAVTLKSSSGKFLLGRPRDKCFWCLKPTPRHVVFTDLPSEETKRWRIAPSGHNNKVALIAAHGEVLRGQEWVDLVQKAGPHELWTPEKNDDGTWSFQSHWSQWLAAHSESDDAITVREYEKRERFRLKSWKSLSSQASGLRRLRSDAHNTYLRADVTTDKVDMIKEAPRLWERWYIQDEGSTVVFRSLNTPRRFLRDRKTGVVDLAREPKEWENWTPIKNDDGTWSFKSVHGRYLSANENGTVRTVKDRDAETNFYLDFWTELVPPPPKSSENLMSPAAEVAGQRRFLSVLHGTYLRALDKHRKVEMGEEMENWNIQVSRGKVIIGVNTTYPALFLCEGSSDGSPYLVDTPKKWEHWTPVKNGDGSWSFKSAHGRWLSARDDGSVGTRDIRDSGEQFWIESTYVEEVTPDDVNDPTTAPPTTTTTTPKPKPAPKLPAAVAAAVLGDWCPKSTLAKCYPREEGGKYLNIPVMAGNCLESKGWRIEEINGKVTLRGGPLSTPSYLRAHPNNTVNFKQRKGDKQADDSDLWTPIGNADGSWSFKSAHGAFLSWHQPNGLVVTMPHNKDCEHFMLVKEDKTTTPKPTTTPKLTTVPPTTTTPKPTTAGPTLPPAVAAAVLGDRCLKSTSTSKCLHTDKYMSIPDMSSTCDDNERWTIEESKGKVVLRRCAAYLRAHPNATVDFNSGAEELWTPIDNGDGTWSFKSGHGSFLSWHQSDGTVVTMPHNKDCEHFLLEKDTTTTAPPTTTTPTLTTVPTTTIPKSTTGPTLPSAVAAAVLGDRCLKSSSLTCPHNGKYVRIPDMSSTCDENERWTIEESKGKVVLRRCDAYLRAHPNATVDFNNEAEELWSPISNVDGTWSFKSGHGSFLSWHQPDGTVVTMPHNKDCEHFLLEKV